MKKTTFILALPLLLAACSSNNADADFQKQLKQAAELGTVEGKINKVFALNDGDYSWLGNRTEIYECKATVKAGIDMDKFNSEKVNTDGDKITIELPEPEIFSYNITPDEIREIFSDIGTLRSNFSEKEREDVFQAAEVEIKGDEDIRNSILKEAKESAKTFFEVLLRQNGYNTININFEN